MQEAKDIIPILWNNRVRIIGLTLATMIIAVVTAFFLPNYYQSTTSFYPVSESLQKPIVYANDERMSFFGNDHDVDRFLAIGQSREIKNKLIEEFALMEHYEIDASDPKSSLKVSKKFDRLYKVQKTQLDAIQVSVEDQDPALSTQICNRARQLIESKALTLTAGARNQMIKSMAQEVEDKKTELVLMTDNIKSIREQYGIYDTQSQAEGLATLQAKSPQSKNVQSVLKNYLEGVSELKRLEIQQEELAKIITYDRNQLKQLRSSQTSQLSAIHIIEEAQIPLEKNRPKRSLIVLGAGLLGGLFSCMLILLSKSIKELDFNVS